MLYPYLWYFFIYAFLGWCSEVIFAAVRTGHFVNRGFLHGPVCPIYGFGVTAVVWLLLPVSDHLLLLYAGSVLLTSALEFFTGWVMEKLFHQKWWDYSSMPFNLGGYVCLAFSLAWGILCVLIVRVIHPIIQGFTGLIPRFIGYPLLTVLAAALLVDLAATLRGVVRFNKSLGQLEEIVSRLDEISERIGTGVSEGAIALRDKTEPLNAELEKRREALAQKATALKSEITCRHKRILEAFPDMKSRKYSGALTRLKEELRRYREEKENNRK